MRRPKTNSERIIEALRSGDALRSPEIAERASAIGGKTIAIQDVASLLHRLTNPKRCDLALFIRKEQKKGKYIYQLVPEALELEPEKLYGLSRKTGKDKYPLSDALKDYPALEKYVPARRKKEIESVGLPKSPQKSRGKRTSDKQIKITDEMINQIVSKIIKKGGLKVDVNVHLHVK